MNQVVIFVALATVVALANGQCTYSSQFSTLTYGLQTKTETASSNLENAISNFIIQDNEVVKTGVIAYLRHLIVLAREFYTNAQNFQNVGMNNPKVCSCDFFPLAWALDDALEYILKIVEDWTAALPRLTNEDWNNALLGFRFFFDQALTLGSKINNLFFNLFGYLLRDTSSQYPTYYGTWPSEIDNFRMNVQSLASQAPIPPPPTVPAPTP